jgi:hypothetical protein
MNEGERNTLASYYVIDLGDFGSGQIKLSAPQDEFADQKVVAAYEALRDLTFHVRGENYQYGTKVSYVTETSTSQVFESTTPPM